MMMNHTSDCADHMIYSDFECGTEIAYYQRWAASRPQLPYLAVIAYLASIYAGTNYMKTRKPMNLKWPLFVWNASLALFSIICVFRGMIEVVLFVAKESFLTSICSSRTDNVAGFWVFLFLMSKFAELGDTFFLVARKRHVMFLHWYHHCSVLLFTWHAFVNDSATGRYFILMNVIVHSIMYTYFALQTLGFRPPKALSMAITTLQIAQMAGGIYVLSRARAEILAGNYCQVPQSVITSGFLMYLSYFLLFVHFFLEAYVFGKKNILNSKKGELEKSNEGCKQQQQQQQLTGQQQGLDQQKSLSDLNSNYRDSLLAHRKTA